MAGQGKTRKSGTATSPDTELVGTIREQQHTGSHDKPGDEAHGNDLRGGTRAGAENVEPKRRKEEH